MRHLLELNSVSKFYGKGAKQISALEDIDLCIEIDRPEIFTIAGESGSGKSTLANLILGFDSPSKGEVVINGKSLRDGVDKSFYRDVQAIFQDPFGVYNPFYRIEHVFNLVIKNFGLASQGRDARKLIEESLNIVGLEGEDVLRKYPHQLSGGQRQRLMMARAFMMKPKLIVADEPVSMVDASLRASILDVMMRLRDEHGISFVYITHDLSTAYQVGDSIMMLYQGRIAEIGNAEEVISRPQHPYVKLLIDSVPKPDPNQPWTDIIELPDEESARTPHNVGCRYFDRCSHRMNICTERTPSLQPVLGHLASCHLITKSEK